MRPVATFALAATLLAAVACGGKSEPPAPIGGEDAAALRQAPTTSAPLAGFTYKLETDLWRDFMPGPNTSPNGQPLIAVAQVTVIDDTAAFPAAVVVDRMWVINGNEVWETVPREEQPCGASGNVATIAVVSREGPRWGPGITVDVVVRLRGPGGATTLLRAAAQPIYKTS